MDFQPRAEVGEHAEADGVRFGKTVGGKNFGRVVQRVDHDLIAAGFFDREGEFRERGVELFT